MTLENEVLDRDAFIARADEAVRYAQAAGRLLIWTIYEKPRDHPDHWVLRGQEIWSNMIIVHMFCFRGESLDETRSALCAGLIRLSREPQDDPHIVEVWL